MIKLLFIGELCTWHIFQGAKINVLLYFIVLYVIVYSIRCIPCMIVLLLPMDGKILQCEKKIKVGDSNDKVTRMGPGLIGSHINA